MSCKLELNKQGKVVGILNQNGNKSSLFQRIFNTPTLTLNEAINAYKNIYSDKLKNKVQFQIIGEVGAQNLDQMEEATIRMDNLKVAKEMEQSGKTPLEIRLATGWEKNLADGKYRYEILDGEFLPATLNFNVPQKLTIENPLASTTLEEIYKNDELYKAYPQLKNTKVYVFQSENPIYDNNKMFVYNNEIFLNRRDYANNTERLTIPDREGTTLVHEIQHLLANIEGFATGSNRIQEEQRVTETINYLRLPNKESVERTEDQRRYDEFVENFINRVNSDNIINSDIDSTLIGSLYGGQIYKRFAGEVESKNVENRFFMSPQERIEQTLQETQDIPFEDQFVLQFKNNIQSSQITAPQTRQEIAEKLSVFDNRIENKEYPTALEVVEAVLPQDILNRYKSLYEMSARNNIRVDIGGFIPYGFVASWGMGMINLSKYNSNNYEELAESINHEIIHGLISKGVRNDYILSKSLEDVMQVIEDNFDKASEEVKNIISYIQDTRKEFRVEDIQNATEEELINNNLRDVGSLEELITYAFTNKSFAEFLDSLPATKELNVEGSSIFSQLKEIIRNFFKRLNNEQTLLDEVNYVLEQYFNTTWNEQQVLERNETYNWGMSFNISPRGQIIGERGASKIEQYDNLLNQAKQLDRQGISTSEIEQQTGWTKTKENQWKYFSNEMVNDFLEAKEFKNATKKLTDVLPKDSIVFTVYPEAKNINVEFYEGTKGADFRADITINGTVTTKNGKTTIHVRTDSQNNKDFRRVLAHEFNHNIQTIEQFPRGGSPLSFVKLTNFIIDVGQRKGREAVDYILSYDTSNLTEDEKKIVEVTKKAYRDIPNAVKILEDSYLDIQGEIDSRAVEMAMELKQKFGSNSNFGYADLVKALSNFENRDLINDAISIFVEDVEFSKEVQVIEPQPNFNGHSTYKEAVINTPINEKIKVQIDDVVIAEITNNGDINDLIRQGIIEDRRELEPSGAITYKTSGANLTMKLVNAHIAKEVLGGKINKAGDIRTEQKEEIEISDSFETNKKELGDGAALAILASDALADNTPAFGVGRIITEEIEIPSETVLMTKLKGLLNQLGVKTMSLEAWEKANGKKATSNALADIGNQIVAFADGNITEDQLSEETSHFIIEALDQEQIKPLLDVVHKTDEWKQYAQTYMEIYKDEAIVRREILGKVLKNALQRKAQETLQGQSVVDRIIGFFNDFINSVRNLLTDNSRQQLDKFTNEVYEKLMAEELYNELSPEQFDGNKLVMYQAQVNDTIYQSISKLTKQMGVIDRRLNSAQKETLSQIEKNLEMADEAMQLEALAGLASVLKKHVTYLNTRGRKQGFLSTEESFVYNTTEDIGKALNALLPKIEISVFKKEKEKALESAKEALTALNELSANLNKEKEDRFQDIVTDLVEKNGLSEQQKDVLLKELRTQTRDTNTFYSWFGGAIHAQNSILNMLAKRVSKMNKETNAVFSQEANTFFSKMNELGFKDEQIAPLMKKWARGNYLFSPYDFVAEEMESNKIRLEVIKKEAKDVYDEYLKTLKTEDKVLEHFSKNQDEWLSKLTQEQNSNYRYLAKEAISDAGLRLDALNKAEREDFNKVMNSLNMSLKTKKLIQEFKDKKNRIFRESKINNGFSEEDLQQLQEINSDYQVASEPYDKDGNLKEGLLIDENGVITASVPKDQLEDDVRVTLELNEYREALKQLYAGKERNVFEGFFNQLQEVRNLATDPIERIRNIENFIKLNTRVFYTEEFWQQSDKNDSIVNKLLELETEEATQIAEEIEFLNRKLKNILKRNKLYNRPSQIDFEFMSAADESEVKDLVTHLETKFREAKTQLPKSEGQTIERAFQSVTNEAYQKELTNRAIAVSNSGVDNKQFVEKLDFIRQHVTDEGMRSINRIRDRVASFDLTKDVPKGLNITKEELMADKNKAVLDYAETKLMPYFKVIQSNKEGASQAENNLIFEMGQSQNAQELESVYNKYKTEYFIDASPSFIFEDADTSDRLNKEYKKRLESNEPLLSDKFFNKEFFDYFGINIGQGFSIDTAVATKNQKEFEAWKVTVGFQEKVLEYGSMKGKHNKYLLPQYRRGIYARGEQIAKGMSREKIKEAFNDAFTYREDDPALGQNVDGEISQIYQKNSLVIPKTGFRRLEAETEVTDELLYSYMLMMREAVKFNKRTEAWADVEAMEHYIKGKTYGDKFGEATNTYKMFNDFKRYNIYGQREAWSWETDMYGLLPKKQNLAPAVNFFQRYVRNNNLAYSILTPMTSFLQGTTNFFVENLVGDRINKDASRLASKEMPKLMTEATSEFFNVRAKSKLNLLLQFMGQESPSERFDNSNYGRALRGASIYKSGYISHYLGDVPIQAQTTLTVLNDYRIVGNDIIDYYSWRRKNRALTEKQAKAQWKTYQDNVIYNHIKPTKDGSLEVDQTVKNIDGWEAKIQQMRDKLTIAKQDIDNQISEGDKGMVQRHALLSWTTLHKGWLVTSMTKRFKEQHLNLFNNMMEEGTYRGTFYFLTNFMKDIKSKGVKNAWKENFKGYDGGYRLEGNIIYDDKGDILKAFDNKKEAEEYYEELKFDFAKMRQISVTRAGIDLVLTSALATLGILLSKMADSDDDDFVKEFVAYSAFRLASEVSSQSFAFPAQAYAFLESPTVGMSQLQNSLDVLDVFDNEEITRGTYKGYSKQQAWFLKAIPGIKELGKIYNIDRTRNSFEFYNSKNLKFTVAGQILLED